MIAWSNLPVLIGPRWRNRDPYERDRFGRARMRQRAAGKSKNHGVNRDAAHARIARKVALAKAENALIEARSAYLQAAQAYWRGERDSHP